MAQWAAAIGQKGESVVESKEVELIIQGRPVRICHRDGILLDNNGTVFYRFNFVERNYIRTMHPHKFPCWQLFFQRFQGGVDGMKLLRRVQFYIIPHGFQEENIFCSYSL